MFVREILTKIRQTHSTLIRQSVPVRVTTKSLPTLTILFMVRVSPDGAAGTLVSISLGGLESGASRLGPPALTCKQETQPCNKEEWRENELLNASEEAWPHVPPEHSGRQKSQSGKSSAMNARTKVINARVGAR